MTTRNSNARFELAPQVEIERSTFDRSCNVKTSFNVGELIPFYVDEVLPGDTFDIQTSKVARLQTLITPIMDNLYLDTYYFFVPNRLVWEHWKEFMGENTSSAWTQEVAYEIPSIDPPENGWSTGTIADYFGLPLGVGPVDNSFINHLPFRAYCLIVNEWFRDENLQDPAYFSKGDSVTSGSNGTDYVQDLCKGGMPFKVCKYHDYFTSCLPAPQKGPDVPFLNGFAPVMTRYAGVPASVNGTGLRWKPPTSSDTGDLGYDGLIGYHGNVDNWNNKRTELYNGSSDDLVAGYQAMNAVPANLWADLSDVRYASGISGVGENVPLSVNDLRRAFQIQRLYEKDARGGTRYIEIIKTHFGVTSPDARLQRPEYLGGNRVPLNIDQVVQTSETNGTPLGDVAGFSQTNDYSDDVHKSFVEHGFIIGLMCARYDHSYQQGKEMMWQRRSRFDFYWPALAHLGEKAVYTSEIYYDGSEDDKGSIFGYQEAWSEYKYKPNYITGQMRSQSAQGGTFSATLDSWHFGDLYSQKPSLDSSWIVEDKSNIDRTLAVQSSTANQVFADIFIKNKCTRPMPLYSIPGFIDHF